MKKLGKIIKTLKDNGYVYMPEYDLAVIGYYKGISDQSIYVGDHETKAVYLIFEADDIEGQEYYFYEEGEY